MLKYTSYIGLWKRRARKMENDIVEMYADWNENYGEKLFMYIPASAETYQLEPSDKPIELPKDCEFIGQINFTILRNRKLEKRKQ